MERPGNFWTLQVLMGFKRGSTVHPIGIKQLKEAETVY